MTSNRVKVPLIDIAYARSGDKGNDANIGLIAFTEEGYKLLVEEVTEAKVASFFSSLSPLSVKRYLLPNLYALNFILEGVLEGGGSRSLHIDAQGKALGRRLLDMELMVPCRLLPRCYDSSLQQERYV